MNFDQILRLRPTLHDHLLLHHNPPSWNWRTTLPDYYNLWISLSGSGTIAVDDRTFAFARGSGILIEPRQSVWAEKHSAGDMVNASLHFTVSAPEKLRPYANRIVNLRHLGLIYESVRMLGENQRLLPPQAQRLWVAQILHLFLLDSRRDPEDPRDRVIRQQIQAIRQKPYHSASVESLAKDAKLSTTQYRRRFKKLAAIQPNAFIINERIEAAKRLLLESALNIDEIAASLGFRDTPFFSRQFKQKTGQSPSRFRRSMTG